MKSVSMQLRQVLSWIFTVGYELSIIYTVDKGVLLNRPRPVKSREFGQYKWNSKFLVLIIIDLFPILDWFFRVIEIGSNLSIKQNDCTWKIHPWNVFFQN